jgi:hypothetical protein
MSTIENDDASVERAERDDLLQGAMIAYQELRAAEAAAVAKRKAFEQATARLIPYRQELAQAAA